MASRNNQTNKVTGHFCLWGNFEIEEVTGLLGIEPSMIYRKGEVLEGAALPSNGSSWDLYCPPKCESMKDQIDALLEMLWPKADVVKELADKFHADFNIGTTCTDVLEIDHETLKKLVALNVKLNCFYTIDEDSDAN